INSTNYELLKKEKNTSSYITRGNIAAIIGGLLEANHPLIIKDRELWKTQLIKYAKDTNDNGVLQRQAMHGLESFKGDTSILKHLPNYLLSQDALIKEAFISLISSIDPNHPITFNYLIQAISDDSAQIIARHALYQITTKSAIARLLKALATDHKFLHEFLDKESIFNNKQEIGDKKLINHIKKVLDPTIINMLKKIIIQALTLRENYDGGESYFLQQIALIVQFQQPNYLYHFIDSIRALNDTDKDNFFSTSPEHIIAVLLKPKDIKPVQQLMVVSLHRHAPITFSWAIQIAHDKKINPQGEKIYQKGLDLGIVTDQQTITQSDYKAEQNVKIYKQFQDYLNPPAKDQYFPEVFRYYVKHHQVLDPIITSTEKKRLIKLAIKSNLDRIDTSKFQVHYQDQETKSGQFTISSLASYYGDLLRLGQLLFPKKLNLYRQQIVNFIPYTFSDDSSTIAEIITNVTDQELKPINKIYLDKHDDRRYLHPQSYIYLVKQWKEQNPKLQTPKSVLESIISDPLIAEDNRESALEFYADIISSSDTNAHRLIRSLWQPKLRNSLSDLANSLLVSVFRDEDAISWRFTQIKAMAKPHITPTGVNGMGDFEQELLSLSFAKPLIELRNEKYLPQFIDLLDYSLQFTGKKDYWESVNYLWRISIAFVTNDNHSPSTIGISEYKNWVEKNKHFTYVNWFEKQFTTAISNSTNAQMRIKNISEAISII
ncbi:MAG: hypothetical protein ACD_58C00261G0001, partial [uncultured bacterium]